MLSCPDGLKGSTIKMEGLSKTVTDSLVILNWADGSSQNYILKPTESSLVIPTQPSNMKVIWDYLVLGVEHILGGIDHLLFVLGLLMIVSGHRLLIKTITAFTVAHSITLGLATLGFVHVPQTPVEAVIALSILFLAVEIIKKMEGKASIAHRLPWIVAFVFGLLHGFGFAGALTQIGLPQSSIPLALLFFNVGVELGQLMFISVVLLFIFAMRRIKLKLPQWAYKMPAYGIGSMAAFWCIERIIAFL
jgi:hydrogenase/urease accessory protein HupE